ncbi:MAG: hypothetical protein V1871_03585 [Planctomycetota bacterium]
MQEEINETQPIEQEQLIEEISPDQTISDAQTISEEPQPLSEEPQPLSEEEQPVSEEEQPISDSQAISESQAMHQVQIGEPKPKSNIFSLLLIISVIFIVLAIYMVAHELNHYYGVTFGGIISVPEKNIETPVESGK